MDPDHEAGREGSSPKYTGRRHSVKYTDCVLGMLVLPQFQDNFIKINEPGNDEANDDCGTLCSNSLRISSGWSIPQTVSGPSSASV